MRISYTCLFVLLTGISLPFVANAQSSCVDKGAAALTKGIEAYNSNLFVVAFSNLHAAADCGNSDAQVNLGYMYARGQATQQNQTEAMRLYQLSANQGNSEGMNAIGFKYQYGTGVAIDMNKAVQWFCKAVKRGNPRALNNMALLYDSGLGVPQDLSVARNLWEQARSSGHTNATFNLGISYLKSSNKVDQERGMKLEIEAAQKGNALAQELIRKNGYQEPLPQPINEAGKMKLQPSSLPAGHAPVCE